MSSAAWITFARWGSRNRRGIGLGTGIEIPVCTYETRLRGLGAVESAGADFIRTGRHFDAGPDAGANPPGDNVKTMRSLKLLRCFAALALTVLFAAHTAAQQPPRQPPEGGRRAVMTGADADAAKVIGEPKRTTVEELLNQPRPADFAAGQPNPQQETKRAYPVETTVWVLDAEIVSHQLMPDGDYRVVLRGSSGRTMVMELPDPQIVGPASRWGKDIAAVRKSFEAKYHPTTTLTAAKGRARVTGVGFFGRPNARGAEGNASGVQVHPALQIEWLDERPTARQPTRRPRRQR